MLSLVFYSPPHHHDHDHYHNHDHHQKHDDQADDDDQVTSARRPTSPTQSTLCLLESSRTGPSPPGERRVWPSKRSSSSSSSSPSSWILLQVNTALAFMVPAIGLILLPSLATPKNQVMIITMIIIMFESFVILRFRFGLFSCWWLRGLSTEAQTRDTYRTLLDLPQTGADADADEEGCWFQWFDRSGTLYGLTNGFGNISGYLVPQLKSYIVQVDSQLSSGGSRVKIYCRQMKNLAFEN